MKCNVPIGQHGNLFEPEYMAEGLHHMSEEEVKDRQHLSNTQLSSRQSRHYKRVGKRHLGVC